MYNEVFLYWHPRIWLLYHLSHLPDIYMYDSTALNFLYSNYTIRAQIHELFMLLEGNKL